MRIKIKIISVSIIVLVSLIFPYDVYAHDKIFPGEKLKTLYPEAISFEQKDLYISDQQSARIEDKIKVSLPDEDLKPSIYFVITKQNDEAPPRKVAVIIFIDAYGDGGKIEIGVVVGRKADLMKILLFENDESAILGTQAFLKQYEGKNPSDVFEVDRDIKAPPGEEKTAQAIASGARRGLLIINELLSKK